MPILRAADNTRGDSMASRLRRARQQLFQEVMAPERARNILDVGGNEDAWRELEFGRRVTVLNLSWPNQTDRRCAFVRANALALPFADGAFDVVFSNSVIEHVGDEDDQRRFASEVRRVGRSYWVQAPSRFFPLEPHFLFPGFQFLPAWLRVRIGVRWPYSWLKHYGAGAAEIEHEARTIRLPSASELRRFLPDAHLRAEKVFGWTKSVIAYLPLAATR
jgi:hypothetical protein